MLVGLAPPRAPSNPSLVPPPSCLGDYNADGAVDAVDLGLLLGNRERLAPQVDLDGDAWVGPVDLGILLSRWGACPS